ncbi:protein of unknown function [Methylococcus capsulatus]|uniref:Uncharacterized protein n=1 Tax=Methylococcus capsulatus TaxID=414 RepID=A0AA35XV18_METCP|nr:protein of unknown function [Methylococcus capsulatus]
MKNMGLPLRGFGGRTPGFAGHPVRVIYASGRVRIPLDMARDRQSLVSLGAATVRAEGTRRDAVWRVFERFHYSFLWSAGFIPRAFDRPGPRSAMRGESNLLELRLFFALK